MAANIELLLDGDLISLTCNLVEPSIEGGTIVARKAQSVGLHPAGLSDDGEAEFFSDDVTVECPAGVFRFEVVFFGRSMFVFMFLFAFVCVFVVRSSFSTWLTAPFPLIRCSQTISISPLTFPQNINGFASQ